MHPPLIRDPLLLKELLGASRRGQMYWGRVIYIGVIALIIYQFWTTQIAMMGLISPSAFAELSRGLFQNFLVLQMLMVTLAAIGGAAERVIREERDKTLGLLLLTPLNARSILYSKWKASMIQAASLIFCGLPVVAICVYLGGVGFWELLWSFSLTLAMASLGAAFGLRASSVYSSIPRAIIMGILYSVGYLLLPIPLMIVTLGFAFILCPFFHPVYSATVINSRAGLNGLWQYSWITSTLVSFLVSWLVVRKAAQRVRARVIAPTPTPPNFVYEQRNLLGRFRVAINVGTRPSRSYREVWESNPLLWKELLTHASSGWAREKVLGYGISAVLFMILFWAFSQGESQGTLVFFGFFFALLTVANGASLFAPEKEGRRMEMLLSAPVSSSSIIRSKLLSGLLAPVSLRIIALAAVMVVAFSYWSGPLGVLIHGAVFFGFLFFAFLLASAASLRAATIQGAALGAMAVLCLILLVLPILVSISSPSTQGEGNGPWAIVSAFNPIWVLRPIQSPRGLDLHEALGRFALFLLVYSGASAGLAGWIFWRFDRIMGRG